MSNGKQRRGRSAIAVVLSHAFVAILAAGAGYWFHERKAEAPVPTTSLALASTGIVPRTSPLHEALEKLPSGVERLIEPNLSVKPVLSYGAMSGIWCRRFELRASTGRTEAIACRGEEEWRIAALTTGPNVDESDDRFPRPQEGNAVIDAALTATMEGAPLEFEDELVILVNGWEPDAVEL